MNRFLKNVFLFVVVVSVVYPCLVFLSGYLPISNALKMNIKYKLGAYGHLYSRLKEVKQLDGNVDILFLGSSHSYRGFDPRNFKGKKTFNLGSSAQAPVQTKILLNRYFDKINPKMVIYEVYPSTFVADGVESSLDLIANDKNDFESVKMALELNNVDTYNTLIYAFFADILNLNKKFVEPITKDDDTYISGGYVEKKIKYEKNENFIKNNVWELNKKQIENFEENIAFIQEKKVNIVLVYAPIRKALYNSYTNNSYVDSFMTSYGLPYYNFNQLMQLDDSLDFYDSHHLNQYGVNKFNSKLNGILK